MKQFFSSFRCQTLFHNSPISNKELEVFLIFLWSCLAISASHNFEGGGGCIQSCDVNALTWPFANELISWAMVTGHKFWGSCKLFGKEILSLILCLQTLRVIWMKLRETPWNSEKVSQTSIQQLHASSVFISAKLSDLQVRCSCVWAALQTGWRVHGQGGPEGAHN